MVTRDRTSFSASFWIVNPVNTFIGNVAAGSTHFGFWFNPPMHPGGPSATTDVCPRNKGLEDFKDNEAHSCGRYGVYFLFCLLIRAKGINGFTHITLPGHKIDQLYD